MYLEIWSLLIKYLGFSLHKTILWACGYLFRKMDHATNIYAVLGKADMHLGASAVYMSGLSELLVAAAQQACLHLPTFMYSGKGLSNRALEKKKRV